MKSKHVILTFSFLIFWSILCTAQWTSPGINKWTGNDPEIESINPDIEFFCTDVNGYSALQFHTSGVTESYFEFDHGDNEYHFTDAGQGPGNSVVSIDIDEPPMTTSTDGFFNIGRRNSAHISMDNNDIQAKTSGGANATLWLNYFGGSVSIGALSPSVEICGNDFFVQSSTNRVGIGTYAPTHKLHLSGGSARIEDHSPYIYLDKTSSGGLQAIGFRELGDPTGWIWRSSEDKMILSNEALGTRGDIVITPDGKIGIGADNPGVRLQVLGNIQLSGQIMGTSDARTKENIKDIDDGLTVIDQLRPVSYHFMRDEYPELQLPEGKRSGLLAQEVEEILPDLVRTDEEATELNSGNMTMKSINYIELIPYLIKAVQELKDENEELSHTVSMLQGQLAQWSSDEVENRPKDFGK